MEVIVTGSWSKDINPANISPCGNAGVKFVSHDSHVFSNDDTTESGEVIVSTNAFPTCANHGVGGLLHVPCPAASIKFSSRVFVVAPSVVELLHAFFSGGSAKTIQFPPISLNGFGIFSPTVYDQKQSAIPNPSVSVGAK